MKTPAQSKTALLTVFTILALVSGCGDGGYGNSPGDNPSGNPDAANRRGPQPAGSDVESGQRGRPSAAVGAPVRVFVGDG